MVPLQTLKAFADALSKFCHLQVVSHGTIAYINREKSDSNLGPPQHFFFLYKRKRRRQDTNPGPLGLELTALPLYYGSFERLIHQNCETSTILSQDLHYSTSAYSQTTTIVLREWDPVSHLHKYKACVFIYKKYSNNLDSTVYSSLNCKILVALQLAQ